MKKLLDSLSTITWLGMDICWMYDFFPGAICFMGLTFAGLFYHAVISTNMTVYDILVQFATWCWVNMNSCWLLSEYYETRFFDVMKTIFMILGVIAVLIVAHSDASKLRSIRKFNK